MEKVFVQWKNYQECFRFSLMEMRRTGDFCDVTLVCEDGDVRAHRLVLSTGSSVFSKMLKSTTAANKSDHKVQLKGIQKDELNWFLDYIYSGQSVINQNEIQSFLKKGNLLGLVGFQQDIQNHKEIQINEKMAGKLTNEEVETPFIDTDFKVEKEEGLETAEKSGTNDILIETRKQEKIENKNTHHNKSNTYGMIMAKQEQNLITINEDSPFKNQNQAHVFAEKLHHNQDDREWTILDVLIRNSLTKISVDCFLCNFCKTEFMNTAMMRVHMEAHFEEFPGKYKPAMVKIQGDKNWKCLECGKVSPKGHIREHIEVHVPGLQYECPDCSANFKSKNNMRSHMVKACPKNWIIQCNFCHFSDKSKNTIDAHTKLNHIESYLRDKVNRSGGCFPCDECGKTTTSKDALRIHKYRHHSVPTEQMNRNTNFELQ